MILVLNIKSKECLTFIGLVTVMVSIVVAPILAPIWWLKEREKKLVKLKCDLNGS